MPKRITKATKSRKEDSLYCKTCGGCGYIGCDGIRDFLEKHVKGKTNCSVEESFILDIIAYIESNED